MRIGMIAPAWLPIPAPGYGGTESVVDTLTRGLRDAGHSVLLVCHPDSTCDVERRSVIPAEDTVRMGRASIELEHAIGAYELVQDCDVVHDHTLAGPPLSRRYPHLPVVATNHMPFTRTMSAIFRASCPPVALVAISHSHASSSPVPVAGVVYHGVNLDDFPVGDGSGGYVAVLSRMAPSLRVARRAGAPGDLGRWHPDPGADHDTATASRGGGHHRSVVCRPGRRLAPDCSPAAATIPPGSGT